MRTGERVTPDPRYPIGKASIPQSVAAPERLLWIAEIAEAPARLRAAVAGLTPAQLDTPYRDGGWSVRQVVHHVPDSHMNAYIRFKLALTEDEPVVKPYDEAAWAKLEDVQRTPIETSLAMLEALHDRWACLLGTLDGAAFARAFRHPELGVVRLDQSLSLYAWHGRHHTAQITALRNRMSWT
jgi:uncharacterized damage-inducible protein DinB